ncbi:hypothetical protein B0H66DRAFT_82867 [Apodospora peruviana]|uniref:Uncharacterized protein n=1 Tax=Apodospora peruviana TaxID=516989 RepID=A0AAE0ITF3_9PEZI|nr:hypothetical protein B0H66DRAFT_82867 [Apodospora peruviana]
MHPAVNSTFAIFIFVACLFCSLSRVINILRNKKNRYLNMPRNQLLKRGIEQEVKIAFGNCRQGHHITEDQ